MLMRLARTPFGRLAVHRVRDARHQVTALPVRLGPWLLSFKGTEGYRLLDEAALRTARRSDTVFIIGSSSSLNELEPEAWAHIAGHDTFGFNWFVRQPFVRCDFHLVRGIPDTDLDADIWRAQLREYFTLVRENPLFDETIFLVQKGFRAINGNRTIGYRLLPEGARVFRWKTRLGRTRPSTSLGRGLVHAHSTLEECVNAAWLLGWREIVLVGVDLYDRRYFWLPEGETRTVDLRRGATADEVHSRAGSGMIDLLADWAETFADGGVRLSVYNPRSLLAKRLPVYESPS